MRIALGCMRLSTDEGRDEVRAHDTIAAALDAGIRLFDTARAYGLDAGDLGHNERLLARTLERRFVDAASVRIVTKCGMRRDDGAWVPDGRASSIADDVRASRAALGAFAIDTLLLHAPDPRTSLATSVRALAKARDEGHARAVGLSNVTRAQLDEAERITRIDAVEVALGAFDDASARGGLVRACGERGIEVLAHAPLGGPKRAGRLARDRTLAPIAKSLGATPAELFLAYLLHVHPSIVALVGARRPESVRSAARAATLVLDDTTLDLLDRHFRALGDLRRPPTRPTQSSREVVLAMGIPGAGKSRAAIALAAQGHTRLNRDALGGSLKQIVSALDEELASGTTSLVLDNTYVSRATRADVINTAHRHGAIVRCLHFDTPVHEAQVNVVLRMLERYGRLLDPEAMALHAKDPSIVRPTVLFRMARELEPPTIDEGFSAIEVVPFVRAPRAGATHAGFFVALDAIAFGAADFALREDARALLSQSPDDVPSLVFGWRPETDAAWLDRARATLEALELGRIVELRLCTHAAGPPTCWCRSPMPGLLVEHAVRHGIDFAQSVLLGTSAVHANMARALGVELRMRA